MITTIAIIVLPVAAYIVGLVVAGREAKERIEKLESDMHIAIEDNRSLDRYIQRVAKNLHVKTLDADERISALEVCSKKRTEKP